MESANWMDTLDIQAAYWVDPHGTATIENITQLPAENFHALRNSLSAGFTRKAHWLRLTITPTQTLPTDVQWMLEMRPAYHDDVQLYTPDSTSSTGFIAHRSGDLQPYISRAVPHRFFVFPLALPNDTQPLTVYVRVQSHSTLLINWKLYERTAFDATSQNEYLAIGLQLGALLAMLLYTMLHWRLLRQQYLVLFIGLLLSIATATFGISGLASQLLFPTQPALANLLAPMGTCLFTFFGMWFYLEFFNVWQRYPKFGWLGATTMAICVVGMFGVFFDFYVDIAPAIMLCSLIAMPFYLLIVWRSIGPSFFGGFWIALAHSWFCAVMLLNQLTVMGFITSPAWVNDWHYNSLVYLMLLMSGVVSRMRESENLRDLAVAQSLEASFKVKVANAQREEKSKFLSLLAHELKTPLATIDAAVQALGFATPADDSASRQRHQRIRTAVKQLNTLLEDALRIARNESQTNHVFAHKEWTDLQSLQLALQEHCNPQADLQSNAHRVLFEWEPSLRLYADAMLVRRALGNLLDNALKYSPPHAPIRMQAHRQAHKGQAGITFEVINAYVGDVVQDCQAWLQPYARGDNSRSSEGLGLGLYLVQSITQAHAGYIHCAIEPCTQAPSKHCFVATLWLPLGE